MYNDPSQITASANQYAQGRSVYHALRTALCESDQYVPLPFVAGGIEMEFQLDTLNNVLQSSATSSTSYTVSSVEFVACLIKPTNTYLKAFNDNLASGGVASMPIVVTKNRKITPSAITDQE